MSETRFVFLLKVHTPSIGFRHTRKDVVNLGLDGVGHICWLSCVKSLRACVCERVERGGEGVVCVCVCVRTCLLACV